MLWSFCSVTWKHWSKPSRPLALTFIWWLALLTAAAPICRINYSPTLDARPFLRSLFSFFDGQCRFGNLAIQPLWRLCLFCQAPLFFRFWRAVPIWEAVKGDLKAETGLREQTGFDKLWSREKPPRCLFSPNIEFFLSSSKRHRNNLEWEKVLGDATAALMSEWI